MATEFVSTVLANLGNLLDDETDLLPFVRPEMEKLRKDLSVTRAVLADAEKKKLTDSSHAVIEWLQKLMDAVYLLDDLLDECSTEAIRDNYEGGRSCAFLSFLYPENARFRNSIRGRMRAIMDELDSINKWRCELQLTEAATERQANQHLLERLTTSVIAEDLVFGREQDKENIVGMLLHNSSGVHDLKVLSIFGMGGIGKTTLAQLVYNDRRVSERFDLKIWINVSENFDVVELTKSVLEHASGTKFSYEFYQPLHVLAEELRAILLGTRYLLVLDDVSNEDPDRWHQLRRLLACGWEGSAVLVTTRSSEVANIMSTPDMEPYHLSLLSVEDCWNIFKKHALRFEDKPNLREIGMEIARKSGGLALIAKALGSLVSSFNDEGSWRRVLGNELKDLSIEGYHIIDAIKLSYLNLPPLLQRCFAFLAIFPKDWKFEKERLVHLWIANGLFSCEWTGSGSEKEDLGDEMVNELYMRSLIQDVETDDRGVIQSFKVHDTIRDLAREISGYDVYVLDGPRSRELHRRTRHLSIKYASEASSSSRWVENVESLRTVINLSFGCRLAFFMNILLHPRIRALDLSRVAELTVLPHSVCLLKHLRYLNLSQTKLETIPESICYLWNLEILNLNWCRDLKMLPQSLGRLRSLRHLCLIDCWSLLSMPPNMGRLTELRTLTFVIVGAGKGLDFQLSDLECLKYLRGSLTIENLERVEDVRDAEKADLVMKNYLQELELKWGRIGDGRRTGYERQQEKTLEALRPAQNLKQLVVSGYRGLTFPQWMMNDMASFSNIQSVSLIFCNNCSRLPPFWRLPSLKKLQLEYMESLICLIECEDSYSDGRVSFRFNSLEKLVIYDLPKLKTFITRGEEEVNMNLIFPRLSSCVIRGTSLSSTTLESLKSLSYLST